MINNRKRLGVYSIEEVFNYINASPRNGRKIRFHGHIINMRSNKLLIFRKNIKCVRCGKLGAFFAKEKYENGTAHINLYGFDKSGSPLLFTIDHIKPQSKGGTDVIYNLQTMCCLCNNSKGNEWSIKEKILYFFRKILWYIRIRINY